MYCSQTTQRGYGTTATSTTSSSSSSNLRGSNGTGAYLLEPLAGGGFPTSIGLSNQTANTTSVSSGNYS